MSLSNEQKRSIEDLIKKVVRKKLDRYSPDTEHKPFHYRLIGKDRMALFSIVHSLNTSFGQSIFEELGEILAQTRFEYVERQYSVRDIISQKAQNEINSIINSLSTDGHPDRTRETERIRAVANKGKMEKVKLSKVDLFVRDKKGNTYLFDIKTAKPNKNEFEGLKIMLLKWIAGFLAEDRDMHIEAYIAIPYNPYHLEPYQWWTAQKMFDLDTDLKVAEQFWDFLGGAGAYNGLLDCFERAGKEIKPELEEFFACLQSR